jgi:hypothetical protein
MTIEPFKVNGVNSFTEGGSRLGRMLKVRADAAPAQQSGGKDDRKNLKSFFRDFLS